MSDLLPVPDWKLLTVDELRMISPEMRLGLMIASLLCLREHAEDSEPSELRGFVLGLTAALLS